MLLGENHLFGSTRTKSSQGSLQAGLILTSVFSLCFRFQVSTTLVSHRTTETTAFAGELVCCFKTLLCNREFARCPYSTARKQRRESYYLHCGSVHIW